MTADVFGPDWDPPDEDVPPPPEPPGNEDRSMFEGTDLGNAKRLAHDHGHYLRYVHAWKTWLRWDGKRWCPDPNAGVIAAKAVARRLHEEVATLNLEAARGDMQRLGPVVARATAWAKRSSGSTAIEAAAKLAQSEPQIACSPEVFDGDPWLLNVENGILDLKSGRLRAHDAAAMQTKLVPVRFDPAARCPTWEAFLHRVQPNPVIRCYLQRLLGYALTGSVGEQVLVFFVGVGANGKSVLLGVVQRILGPYALQASSRLLLVQRYESAEYKHECADLFGRRLALCQELPIGQFLNEPLVKQLTGGDRITGRRLYQDSFEFNPTHKIIVAANDAPQVVSDGDAIWRRIHLVPFEVVIPPEERDQELPAKLDAENEGILAWMVHGCLEWQRLKLLAPAEVHRATSAYRESQDRIAEFLEECTERDESAHEPSAAVYDAYKAWCAKRKEQPLVQNALSSKLNTKGFRLERKGGVRAVLGLRVKT